MGWVEAIEAAKQFKSDFVAVKGKFKSWLDTYFNKLSQRIGTKDVAKPKETSKSTSTIETTKSSTEDVAVVSNEWSKSIDYPELANKKLMEFDAGLSAVQATWFSEFRIKDKLDQSKLSAEQIKNLDAFDKVQASLYIMLRNASKRDLPAGFLMRASVVMTKDLFDHIGNGKSSWWFDLSKTTEWINELTSNKTIWAWVWEFKKSIDSFGQSIKESWITDMLNTVQTGLSMFNDIPEVSKKWNNFFAWIWDGDLSGIDLTKSSIPAIYTVYQWCKSWYPSTEQTQWLNVVWNDADWIGKNSGKMLSTDATMLWYLDKNTKQIIDSIINKENQDTLKKIVNQWESIVDTLLSAAGDSEYAINTIESILKRLSGIFGWDAMRTLWSMLGVDMSTLLDTLDAKLSPKQEQQLTAFLKNYKPNTNLWPHEWEQYITDDPESKKQWIIKTINLSDIKAWLTTMTPSASLVSSFAGEDVAKRSIYFDKDESWALTVLKSWPTISDADKWAVGDYYLKDEATIKNLIKDVTWAEWDDMKVVGRATTWYMKWARGKQFYDNYKSEHVNNKKEVKEEKKDQNPEKITKWKILWDLTSKASEYPDQAWAKNNNPAWITWSENFLNPKEWDTAYIYQQAWIKFEKWTPRPAKEWLNYVKFATIEDWLKAQQLLMTEKYWGSTVEEMLKSWVGVWDKVSYAKTIASEAGINLYVKVNELTQEQLQRLQMAKIKKESGGLYNLLTKENYSLIASIYNSPAYNKEQLA